MNSYTPEPDPVTLPGWAVERLRIYLAKAKDDTKTDEYRREAMVAVVGALDYHLNGLEEDAP